MSSSSELERQGSSSCAVLFIDIDRFKLVNDGHGHDAGDSLLREAGGRLQSALREGDVLSRFGGDEFTAYLPDCDAGSAEMLARRVLVTLAQPFPSGAARSTSAVASGSPSVAVIRRRRPP